MQRVALVTGGAGDLARAIREKLLQDQWEVHAPGKDILDVTSPDSASRFLRGLPRLDYLVHTAGILRDRSIAQMEESDWDAVHAVNLRGAFHVARLAWEMHMHTQKSGHILFISSGSARYGITGQANYASAKAGLLGLMQSFAREYGPSNVRVNAILPGFLQTKMTAHVKELPVAQNVLERLNTVEEVARFVTFLDTLPHTSGQVFQLDSRIGREL